MNYISTSAFFVCIWMGLSMTVFAQEKSPKETPPVQFHKVQVASESFVSVGVFDVNNDGDLDIVSGAFWYEGPDFPKKRYIREIERYGEYWDDFATISIDVNNDGHIDYITGGWFRKNIRWHENPGDDSEWEEHIIDQTGNVEAVRSWDVDGDGYKDIVPNNPNDSLKFYKLNRDNNEHPGWNVCQSFCNRTPRPRIGLW